MIEAELSLPESERFHVLRRIGSGATGVVYEALDRERNLRVALKVLTTLSAAAIMRFKDEFRRMQDLHHPNLGSLGELHERDGQWFFTMELVEGTDFLSWVRPDASRAGVTVGGPRPLSRSPLSGVDRSGVSTTRRHDLESPATDTLETAFLDDAEHDAPARVSELPLSGTCDERRLRAALAQLAAGLGALHAAGMIHRDIKPSNVLVAEDGRVVIVDFGLVHHLTRSARDEREPRAVGTAHYMAPEQASGRVLGPEADWYAVGVMLYEAVTGRLPLRGSALLIITQKQTFVPEPPRLLVPSISADLDALIVELLNADPAKRPREAEIEHRLGLDASDSKVPSEPPLHSAFLATTQPLFLGRERELSLLRAAYREAVAGRGVTVLIKGESGLGKTALVRHFVEELSAEPSVVLSGRCYERELVPYKAFDNLIDELSRHLVTLSADSVERLVPRHAALLTQVFPVLRNVPAFLHALPTGQERADPQELRALLFAALRELLSRLAARVPLVLTIDDLQWADAESLALLAALTRPPDAPALLLVTTLRSATDAASSTSVERAILGEVRDVPLSALSPEQARELATLLLSRAGVVHDAESIALEAAGHPLFIDELARHAALFVSSDARTELRLDDALWTRISRLEPKAKRFLELVAVAGAPWPQALLARAAFRQQAEASAPTLLLRAAHLVRTTGTHGSDLIEPYHDRVREAVLVRLSEAQLAAHHQSLALALESRERSDPEALYAHWSGAQNRERASHYAVLAAGEAERALAFQRAAALYRSALEQMPPQGVRGRELRLKLADALAHAGHGKAAADVYLDAAHGADAEDTLKCQRKAADQLLRSGYVDEAFALLREVLRAVGLALPGTPRRAWLSLLSQRLRLLLRGLDYRARSEGEIAPATLERIDVCWSAATGLLPIDTVRGLDFQTHALVLSLDAGEPYRIARSLALEGGSRATAGQPARKVAMDLLAKGTDLAHRTNRPHALGVALMSAGCAHHLLGEWRMSLEACRKAEQILRERCRGVAWEIGTARRFALGSLYYLGDLVTLSNDAQAYLRDALDRGDLYAATNVRTGRSHAIWLSADEPERAQGEVAEAFCAWSHGGYHTQHFYALQTQLHIDLYVGDAARAAQHLAESWQALSSSLLMRVQLIRVEALHLRARVALACGELEAAERAARRILREGLAWATPLARLVQAGVHARRDDRTRATHSLTLAAQEFAAADMLLLAAITRHCLRQLAVRSGEAYDEQGADAATLRQVKNLPRFARVHAPGFDA